MSHSISLRTLGTIRTALIAVIGLSLETGCSHLPKPPLLAATPPSPCANIDWYEVGRLDGLSGDSLEKMEEQKKRCVNNPQGFDQELYINGRDSGLVEFCSPYGGFEAGKNGVEYENVCPTHQEPGFLSNHRLGAKIRQLEVANEDLAARISNLSRLISPASTSSSIRTQIENLRSQRAQNNMQIIEIENRVGGGTGHF